MVYTNLIIKLFDDDLKFSQSVKYHLGENMPIIISEFTLDV